MKTYTTSLGNEIEISPIPPMLIAKVDQATRAQAEKLHPATKPTYEVVDAGGGIQTFEHDADSLATDAERAAWATYQDAMTARTAYINDKMLRFFLMRGLNVQLPDDSQWELMQGFWGVDVPQEPMEKLLHYIQTEILGSAQDIMGLTEAIMAASGVAKEDLDAAKASFRGGLRQGSGSPGGISREIPATQPGPALDDIPALPRITDGQSLAPYAHAMG